MKSIQPQAVSNGRGARGVLLLILFAAVAAVVFHALWQPGAVLLSSDDNVGLLRNSQRMLENSVVHPWMGETLWGMPTMSMVRPGYLLLKAVPAEGFMNAYHGLCLALAAWLLALYLRDRGLRPAACAFGGLVAFWTGTNLTLTYAGHVGKYGTLVFLALATFALGRWGRTKRQAWGVLAGAAAGAMFLEQADVALFCALLLAPLGVLEAARAANGWKIAGLAKHAWAPALVAALLAGGASLAAKGSGVTEATDDQTPAERWAYITQWSQPPSESLDFIAPGWTGWRSGDEKGPYWGKMGRSAGYEQTGQGFMNFKLENVYVGAIPLLFALLGLATAIRRRREEPEASAAALAWGALCVVALLLAFGKFFVLYKPLSWLPGIGSIRNPNKFIHFFQMAWGVLAAFGLDAALQMEPRAAKKWTWGPISQLPFLKISHQVLVGMQNADDFDPLPFQPIDHKMRATGMNPHRRCELPTFPGQFGEFSEQVEDCEQTVSIALCLFDTPTGSTFKPNFRKVAFCGGPNDPTARSRHAVRASGS